MWIIARFNAGWFVIHHNYSKLFKLKRNGLVVVGGLMTHFSGKNLDHFSCPRRGEPHGRGEQTYIKVKGQWKYLYRAVDKQGNTIDFLLTAKRDKKAALRFLNKAISRNGKPSLINIDQSAANTAGINQFNKVNNKRIKIRQCKYVNNIVEQDHRFIKKLVRATLGFKRFHSAQKTIKVFELIRILNKGQIKIHLTADNPPSINLMR